jgi:hypothetical protein
LLAASALALGLSAGACGGDDSAPTENVAGSPSTGGTSSVGGSTSTGGTTGDACTVPTAPISCALEPAPKTTVIDFSSFRAGSWGDTAAGDLTGGTSPYHGDGVPDLNTELVNGALHVFGSLPATKYVGLVFWFGPCVDLSTLADGTTTTGLELVMGGDLAGATLKLQVQTEKNYPVDTVNTKGSCMFDDCATRWDVCVPPTATFSIIPEAANPEDPLEFTWDEFIGGAPEASTNGAGVVGLQFQFECSGSETECAIDITLQNITLTQ